MTRSLTFDIREIFPYLCAFRDRTFVISASADLLLEEQAGLIEDLMLLAASGIRLVLIADEHRWLKSQIAPEESSHPYSRWQLSDEQWPTIAAGLAYRYFTIQAVLTRTIRRQDLNRQFVQIHSGSYVRARPRGIFNGRDLAHNGMVRNINHTLLQEHLRTHGIILLPGLAASSSGSLHWIAAEEIATSIAISSKAKKWLHISTRPLPHYFSDTHLQCLKLTQAPTELTNTQVKQMLSVLPQDFESSTVPDTSDTKDLIWRHVYCAISQGVDRVHFIHNAPHHHNALLAELFTHHGSGIMITSKELEVLRPANIDDVGAIFSLLEPLEQDGTLIPRSREHIEHKIANFLVMLYDNRLVGCAALLPLEEDVALSTPSTRCAELSCMTISHHYRRQGYGALLLNAIFERGRQQHYHKIFLLTARAHEWFEEHGFTTVNLDALPIKRRQSYDMHRSSKIMLYQEKKT